MFGFPLQESLKIVDQNPTKLKSSPVHTQKNKKIKSVSN